MPQLRLDLPHPDHQNVPGISWQGTEEPNLTHTLPGSWHSSARYPAHHAFWVNCLSRPWRKHETLSIKSNLNLNFTWQPDPEAGPCMAMILQATRTGPSITTLTHLTWAPRKRPWVPKVRPNPPCSRAPKINPMPIMANHSPYPGPGEPQYQPSNFSPFNFTCPNLDWHSWAYNLLPKECQNWPNRSPAEYLQDSTSTCFGTNKNDSALGKNAAWRTIQQYLSSLWGISIFITSLWITDTRKSPQPLPENKEADAS